MCCRFAIAPGAEIAQQPHHVVIVLRRRRIAAEDPIEQIGIGAFEQRFKPIELTAVEAVQAGLGERAENEVALLRPAMPAAEQQPPAPGDRSPIARVLGTSAEIRHRKLFRWRSKVDDVARLPHGTAVHTTGRAAWNDRSKSNHSPQSRA